ncbi:MAG: HEAT repeat domain-containing protein [Gemmataceae bacterium]|nr:HEAT repeat domain-containing protein [Gemmataceae bacterium]
MTRQPGSGSADNLRHWPGLIAVSCLLLAGAGCAARWDEMLSRERDWSYITGFGKPDPLVVIRDNPSGDRKAQALCELREPLKHGGDAQKQDIYLKVLGETATKDPQPLCRLTAIRCLGNYKDPRAARVLEGVIEQQHHLFANQENNVMVRTEALVALEKIHDPDSKGRFIVIARGPGPTVVASLKDRYETQDERIVAIRALGKYREQDSRDALVHVLKTERDVALRDRALAALEESTGKKWPAQREAWQRQDVQPLPGESLIQRVTGLK